ncbi:MAG: PQQ-binding-like beta-propeller repeat protein [Planctomycetaceae bacterium]
MIKTYSLLIVALLFVGTASAEDWRQFRGNDANGVAKGGTPPAAVDDSTLGWRVDLPGRGLASPIVIGDKVVVSASSGGAQERLHVLCFNVADGKLQWERQFWATGRTVSHPKTSVAAPTPCSDGERIFAFFSSNDVVCLDLDGQLQWFRGLTWDYPNSSNSLGMSSSPVVVGKTLVCMAECDDDSFSVGLNVVDGTERWKLAGPRKANWTSPAIWRGEKSEGDRVLLQSSKGVVAVEPMTGKVEWSYEEGASTIPSLVCSKGLAFVPSNGITAIRPSESHPEVPELVWRQGPLSPGTASPVVTGDSIYVINRSGAMTCASREDGERRWQLRLTGAFSGTPVIAGDLMYVANEEGVVQVIRLGATEGTVLTTHELKETVLSTPAIAGKNLFIRSENALWMFTSK